MVLEAAEVLVKLGEIAGTVGISPNQFVRDNLRELGTEMVKLFEQEELL